MPFHDSDEAVDYSLDSTRERPTTWGSSLNGCGYLLFIFVVTTGMLIVNAIVCLSIHSALMSFGPEFLRDPTNFGPHLGQLFFFIVPVVLTILQWNLIDRLNRIFGRSS